MIQAAVGFFRSAAAPALEYLLLALDNASQHSPQADKLKDFIASG